MIKSNNQIKSHEINDPDPFSLIMFIVSTCALLIGLKQKIESSKRYEEEKKDKKATRGIILNLNEIKKSLYIIKEFLSFFDSIGQDIQVSDYESMEFGSIQKLLNENEYEIFNTKFDELLKNVGIINKSLYRIKIKDIILDKRETNMMYEKLEYLKMYCNQIIQLNLSYEVTISKIKSLIEMAEEIIYTLSSFFDVKYYESENDGLIKSM